MRRRSRPLALAAALAGAVAGTMLVPFAAGMLHARAADTPTLTIEN
ncbi:hypothetical protein [Allosphingosinicella deserti]|nr:hypothetical protein [Sphingomonas deserti]